jgi:glycosyltransferase involved in cell wall biosynthesis
VAALRELVARGVDARLELLGSVFDGYEWFEAELRDTVSAAGLIDRVDFLGFRSDVWPELAAADVVLIPSVVDEPFGNTAVEALLAGRPVVVSRTSGLLEAVAGFSSARTVAPGDPAALADAVQQVRTDWSQLRDAAARDAVEATSRYSPERYQRLLADQVAGLPGHRHPEPTSRREEKGR